MKYSIVSGAKLANDLVKATLVSMLTFNWDLKKAEISIASATTELSLNLELSMPFTPIFEWKPVYDR